MEQRVPALEEEARHVTGAARCACGRASGAPNGLPEKGNSGRRLAGPVPGARRERVPLGVAGTAGAVTGVRTAGSAASGSGGARPTP